MKYYVYLTNDRELGVKLASFIEEEDPGYWSRNSHLIDTLWPVDTEDLESVIRMLTSFKYRELRSEQVRLLCSQIGFDLQSFLDGIKKTPSTFQVDS